MLPVSALLRSRRWAHMSDSAPVSPLTGMRTVTRPRKKAVDSLVWKCYTDPWKSTQFDLSSRVLWPKWTELAVIMCVKLCVSAPEGKTDVLPHGQHSCCRKTGVFLSGWRQKRSIWTLGFHRRISAGEKSDIFLFYNVHEQPFNCYAALQPCVAACVSHYRLLFELNVLHDVSFHVDTLATVYVSDVYRFLHSRESCACRSHWLLLPYSSKEQNQDQGQRKSSSSEANRCSCGFSRVKRLSAALSPRACERHALRKRWTANPSLISKQEVTRLL